MKKLLSSLILTGIIMCGCSQNKNQNSMVQDQPLKSKTLVTYFSASGATKGVAEKLSRPMGADIYPILPETPYTDADLDWRNKNSRSSVEMRDENSRPAIKRTIDDVSSYETVYIGFPIWWYTAPTIINTFIESYDLTGKNVYLFATSGGSSIDKAFRDLKAKYPNIKFVDAKLLNSPTDEEIKSFIK